MPNGVQKPLLYEKPPTLREARLRLSTGRLRVYRRSEVWWAENLTVFYLPYLYLTQDS
ncbi:MAG: hypothetical protein IGS49_05545 [Chlorogloeopsis fritschii C42_A2020_084]|nr:hypothetical protein [Chlorogloeopsis fritschii C42_A2020_084]